MRVSELAALAKPPAAHSLAAAAPPIPRSQSQSPSADFAAVPGAVLLLCADNKKKGGGKSLHSISIKSSGGQRKEALIDCRYIPVCVMSYFPLFESTECGVSWGGSTLPQMNNTITEQRAPPPILDYLADYKLQIPYDNGALKGYFFLCFFLFVLFFLSLVTFNKIKWANSDCLLNPQPHNPSTVWELATACQRLSL